MKTLSWRPSTPAAAKLFLTGATVGPIVDSVHNQCLLKYNVAPISLPYEDGFLLCSSWTVPPLLGIAYVVLGGVLPRLFQILINATTSSPSSANDSSPSLSSLPTLRNRAFLAVATTALIIKLSEFLEVHPTVTQELFSFTTISLADQHIVVLLLAAFAQWAWLDRSAAALLAASITSIGGPLSELPFVSHHVWEYLETAGDYLPLRGIESGLLQAILGDNYQHLALSSITGPCYFAVTMDAIALGRWFEEQTKESSR